MHGSHAVAGIFAGIEKNSCPLKLFAARKRACVAGT
jgi:hypothetical protein